MLSQVLISKTYPHTAPMMLGRSRYTFVAPVVEAMKSIKNEVEIEGLENAYRRDSAAIISWLAWLEGKIQHGSAVTEYDAAYRLTEIRKGCDNFVGLAYENISASGPNAGRSFNPDNLAASS